MAPSKGPTWTVAPSIVAPDPRCLGGIPQLAAGEPLHDGVRVLFAKSLEGGQQFFPGRGTERGRKSARDDRPICVTRRHAQSQSPSLLFWLSRLSFSTSVVRLIRSNSAALFRLPPVRSSARPM